MRSYICIAAAAILLLVASVPGYCQADNEFLQDLGIGDLGALGGMGGLGNMGLLGALGGGMLTPGAKSPAPTIIISQPAMLIANGSLYIAQDGKITKFDASTLQKQAEAWYAEPKSAGMSVGDPTMLPAAPAPPKPPLVPGATPSTGPK